jgi:hypothetical protein
VRAAYGVDDEPAEAGAHALHTDEDKS